MPTIYKIFLLIICINTFLYLGGNYGMEQGDGHFRNTGRIQGDLFDHLLSDKSGMTQGIGESLDAMQEGENYTGNYRFNMQEEFTTSPNEQSGLSAVPNTAGFSFLDVARMIIPFFKTLFNLGIAPITMLTQAQIPPLITAIVAIPLTALYILTVIVLLRGGGAA